MTMNADERQQMLANAPIPQLVIRLSVPTIISMLVTSLYNMADTFFVGQISTSATAAVGVVFPLMAIIQACGFFFGHGSGNTISRKLGAGKTEEARWLSSCGFYLALFTGCLFALLCLLFVQPLSRILGSTDTILPYTIAYMRIIVLGAPIMMASFVLNNQLRFQGFALYSMIGMTFGGVLNMFLDPLLIFYFEMGIAGAAVATVFSQTLSLFLLLFLCRLCHGLPHRISDLKYVRSLLASIIGGGLPSLCRQGLASIATIALNLAAKPYGDAAIAAMSVVSRIMMFANSTTLGFGQGFQPICGFNYGAGNKKRVIDAFWFCMKLISTVLVIAAVIGFVFSPSLVAVFRRNDPEVIRIGALALRAQCITLPLSGWIILNNMFFQTIGYTLPASILASSRQGICFLPLILVLPLLLGLTGVQTAQAGADICTFLLALYFHKTKLKDFYSHPTSQTQA